MFRGNSGAGGGAGGEAGGEAHLTGKDQNFAKFYSKKLQFHENIMYGPVFSRTIMCAPPVFSR